MHPPPPINLLNIWQRFLDGVTLKQPFPLSSSDRGAKFLGCMHIFFLRVTFYSVGSFRNSNPGGSIVNNPLEDHSEKARGE